MFHRGSGILCDVSSLRGKVQHALQTFEFAIDRRSFDRLVGIVFRRLLPALVTIRFDHPDGDVVQLAVAEKQVLYVASLCLAPKTSFF